MSGHLTPLDATFLELEEGDESAHMHVGWAMLFDPLPGGGTPSLGQVRELFDERLGLLPRFRCRLSSPRIGRLSWPSWTADPGFDVANHVRHATLPALGEEAELLEWLGDFYSHRLDRAHPLWESVLLDGLAGGGWALATKVHHSLVDGISGNSVTTVILDAEPDPAPGSKGVLDGLAESEEEPEHGHERLATLAGIARAGVDTVRHPRKLGALLERSREIAGLLVDELIPAPHTSLNVGIGGSRRMAAVHTSLDELKQVKNGLGGTVNDVVLAATAGGLRRLFEQRGERLDAEALRVMVPVSVRRASEQLALGNRVSSLFVDLPIAEPDPLLRYRKTVAASRELKGAGQSRGGETLVELAGAAPPLVHGVVARLAFTPRLFNLTITNVPGVQTTLYSLGAPLQRVVPLVPIFAGHALGVAVVSYDGKVSFGINADRVEVPDIDVLRDGIAESLAELRKLAAEAGRRDDGRRRAA
jgi:diacylglycerol O-acyltransferase